MQKRDLNQIEVFKKKTLLFIIDGKERVTEGWDRNFFLTLKDFFGTIIFFNWGEETILSSFSEAKNSLYRLIEETQPEYCFLTTSRTGVQFVTLELIQSLREKFSELKTMVLWTDEDVEFDLFYRYMSVFIDFVIANQYHFLPAYQKDGLGYKVGHMLGSNTKEVYPLELKKEYDVIFFGRPTKERAAFLIHLLRNGIDLPIFGDYWRAYPELLPFCRPFVSNEELVRIMNQSKILLSFSKNGAGDQVDGITQLHYKGRVFEAAACKAFQLVEYFKGYLHFFKENKEIVFFKNNQDLLKKIQYYLSHEKEREQIAERAYQKVIKKHNAHNEMSIFLKKILDLEKNATKKLSVDSSLFAYANTRVMTLLKEAVFEEKISLREKLSHVEFVAFKDLNDTELPMKNFLQIYSLEKTQKNMSCCAYYVSSKRIGDYLTFRSKTYTIVMEEYNMVVDLSQLLIKKEYFLKHLDLFRRFQQGENVGLLSKKNTAFIDIPLFRTTRLKKNGSYRVMERACKGGCLFLFHLIVSIKRRKLVFDSYPYKLFFTVLFSRNFFVFKYLFHSIFNKKNWNKNLLRVT